MKIHCPKFLVLFLLLAASPFATKAQWVTIPDADFAAFLRQQFPACMNGSQMDTTCNAIITCKELNLPTGYVVSIEGVRYFDRLTKIYCPYNQLSTLPILPDSLFELRCNDNEITIIPLLPAGLSSLLCQGNKLTTLPVLPANLKLLFCGQNQLASLPALPASLTGLDCSLNNFTTLPAMPPVLQLLNFGNNPITTLPVLPNTLTSLICDNTLITTLPQAFPPYLQFFSCYNNNITQLPTLNSWLTQMSCSGNKLTSLPVLPPSLKTLDCARNLLTALPALPSGLTRLDVERNLIDSIPDLPAALTDFNCGNNGLTRLPALPPGLMYFHCDSNQLTEIPPLPATGLAHLDVHDNPGLRCLPPIRTFSGYNGSIDLSATGIKCLAGVIEHPNEPSLRAIDTLPICDPFNTNGCDIAWNLYGRVTRDADNNCSTWVTEPPLARVKVKLSDRNGKQLGQMITGVTGRYSFDTQMGVYKTSIDEKGLPLMTACPTGGFYQDSIYVEDSLRRANIFGMRCKNGFDVGAWDIESRFRQADTARINISAGDAANFYGTHCANGVSGKVTVSINGPVKYLSHANGARVPDIATSTYIVWNIADFGTTDCEKDFDLVMMTDTTAQAGQRVCFTISVTPTIGDFNPANNTYTFCREVMASFDPNEKVVSPIGMVDPADGWLDYTVYFQNTGNDTARNIVIRDTLSPLLDITTFQVTGYSVLPETYITEEGAVKFFFANIYLPDSNVNEPASHGYVQYRVKLKDGVGLAQTIRNTAYIYFDFNAPVITNTTLNETGIPAEISEQPKNRNTVNLFPNPANNILYIATTGKAEWATVYDMNGRKINEVQFTTNMLQLNIATLPAGVYFVEVKNGGEVMRKKFVKQ